MTEGTTQVQKKHVQWGISRVDPQKVPDFSFNFFKLAFSEDIYFEHKFTKILFLAIFYGF